MASIITQCKHFKVLTISGRDCKRFLQMQTCNDLNQLAPQTAQLNAICAVNGRVIAVFYLWDLIDQYRLIVHESLASELVGALRRVIFRSKVEIAEVSESALYGISLSEDGKPPSSIPEVRQVKLPHQSNRYFWLGAPALIKDKIAALHFQQASEDYWTGRDVADGVPIIDHSCSEKFLPQAMNLDCIQGISFRKGCFPGQEIIIRVEHRGRVKERMIRATIEHNKTEIRNGSVVYDANNRAVGTVIQEAVCNHRQEILAVIKCSVLDSPDNQIFDGHGNSMMRLELPYSYSN